MEDMHCMMQGVACVTVSHMCVKICELISHISTEIFAYLLNVDGIDLQVLIPVVSEFDMGLIKPIATSCRLLCFFF